MSVDLPKVTLFLPHNTKSSVQGGGDSDSDDAFDDEEDEYPWMCTLVFRIQVENRQVGSIIVYIIQRGQMAPGDFHALMDEPDQELSDLALAIFDHNGRLRSELSRPSGRKKGTGVWGQEMSSGDFAYISEFRIDSPADRSQGIGTVAMQELSTFLAEPWRIKEKGYGYNSSRSIQWILCWPVDDLSPDSTKPREELEAIWNARQDQLVRAFRKWGFRRIGNTRYFGYANGVSNNDHPSRHLRMEDDAPGPSTAPLSAADDCPLHSMIINSEFGPDMMAPPEVKTLPVLEFIANAPLSTITQHDWNGSTPLHAAAFTNNLRICSALLGRSRAELMARNNEGQMPVDIVKASMATDEDFLRMIGLDSHEVYRENEARRKREIVSWFESAMRE